MERAAQLVARAQRGALGLEDPVRDQLVKPIAEHVADFEAVLRAGGVGDEHLRDRKKSLSDFVVFAKVRRLLDLELSSASRWLSGLRDGGLSARTVNKRAAALRQFGKWAQACRRIEHNPFASLPLQKEKLDRRRVRRALTFDEFHELLRATRLRPLVEARRYRTRKGVTESEETRLLALGRTRALVYTLAATTALRREELAGLCWGEVDLDRAVASIPATRTKSEVDQQVTLDLRVVAKLRVRRPAKPAPTDLVVPPGDFPTMRTFRRDLEAAGIAYRDASGRVVDFHALRGTVITWLQATGSLPQEARALARHAKLETTMKHYTDSSLFNLRGALDRLPLRLDEDVQSASGT